VLTRRFKKLAAAAGLPEINLHDVRHSYATAGRDAKIDWKDAGKAATNQTGPGPEVI
jgi:integrase